MKKLSLVLVGVLVFAILSMALSPVYAGRDKGGRDYWRDTTIRRDRYPRYRRYPRIRFTGKDIDRLLFVGGIYFLSKAISEARRPKKEIIYVSPPPVVYVSSPQPTYTPSVSTTVVTVRNVTNWYIVVSINGMQLNLYPGYEQAVSWMYTGMGHYVEARAYQDRRLVGTYQGNLVGYQIPWILNLDYCSFAVN